MTNKDGYYYCICREDADAGEKPCVALKDRKIKDKDGHEHVEQYVHFATFNNRLDGWYSTEELRSMTVQEQKLPEMQSIINEFVLQKEEILKRECPMIKYIDYLVMAGSQMETWYHCPLPDEFQNQFVYCCEFCLNYISNERAYKSHMERCQIRRPPGNEIYRDNFMMLFEVDGALQKNYCRNISYLARMFLLHKTLYVDVDVFFFYVLYVNLGQGFRLVGYFSKEKPERNILSCILTLPCYQSKGIGTLLIDMAYMLSLRDNMLGGPERPLSDLGHISFTEYWKIKILQVLLAWEGSYITIADLVQRTGFTALDITATMRDMKVLLFRSFDQQRRNPEIICYFKREYQDFVLAKIQKAEHVGKHNVDEKRLHYWPFVYFRRPYEQGVEKLVLNFPKSQ